MSGMVNVGSNFPSATEVGGSVFQLLKLIDNQDEYKKRIEELSAAEKAANQAHQAAHEKLLASQDIIEKAGATATAVNEAQAALAKAREDFTKLQAAAALDLQQKQQKLESDAAKLAEDAAAFHASYDSKSAELQQRERSLVAMEVDVNDRVRRLQRREATVERQMARIKEIAADA